MRKVLILPLVTLFILQSFAQFEVRNLLCDYRINPLGIDNKLPGFSWQLVSASRNIIQTDYEIKLRSGKELLWETGKVHSGQSVQVMYTGKPLNPGKKYNWQVRVWDNAGNVSGWSEPGSFETGLFNADGWKAKWIIPGFKEDALRASPLFRKTFTTTRKVIGAYAYITAHGLYEAAINGQKVGDAFLTPGWTSYKKRVQYQVYDVTSLIKKGGNAIGVTLGSGWYRGVIGFGNNINVFGNDIALLMQVNIQYSDGTADWVVTDETWKSSTGSIVYSEIYNGETIDARKEQTGWTEPGFNDSKWLPVTTADFSKVNLIATENEPVRKHEVFHPVKIITTPAGEKVIDFGQNLVGWVVMKVKGKSGDKITLSHAEVLDKKGNVYTENLRNAKAQDTYILRGGETEIFEPHFTWQGFRYVKVEGYPGEITADNFEAVALYSDMKVTGTFTSSNSLINQLQHNIQWGQKGNFLDVPTDCPQRDERLGWTGDAQVFSRTAAFNMNVHQFFSKWLKDVAADQQNGAVPFVIPNVLGKTDVNSAGWSDVCTIIPWNIYLAYGDLSVLKNQYASIKAYVESIRKVTNENLWNTGFHFGDWLFYRPEDDNDGRAAVTDKYLIAQCFYAHSTRLLLNAARLLNETDDVNTYTELLDKIKVAFRKEYLTPNGRLVSGTQTAYVLALNFDMLPDSLRPQAAQRLVENIKSYGYHLTTGFLGTPYLCHVLTRFGYTDIAYKLLLQETYPSWLYPVKMGATTIWERWDGQKPDSSFQTPGMNSFNHYAYGAIGDWLYRDMAGLDTDEDTPGYKHAKIMPHTGGGFTAAAASLETYYGKLSSGWTVEKGKTVYTIEIPANTGATVCLPAANIGLVSESGKLVSEMPEIKIAGSANGLVILELGSGTYHFSVAD